MKTGISNANPGRAGERFDEQDRIIDRRSVVIGLVVAFGIFAGAAAWKLAVAPEKKLSKMADFVFKPEPPKIEKVEPPPPPQQTLMKQMVKDTPTLAVEKRINIQTTIRPQEATFQNAEIQRSVDVRVDVDVKVSPMDMQDSLDVADVKSDDRVSALDPIAVLANEPGDLYRYETPRPRVYKKTGLIGTAPTLGTTLRLAPMQVGDQAPPAISELGPVDMNIFGGEDDIGALKRESRESRSAVELALRWLATHQNPDGSWVGGAEAWNRKGQGRWDADDAPFEDDRVAAGGVAGTGFAVIALMGGGHNLRRGEHRSAVIRGVEWLMSAQN